MPFEARQPTPACRPIRECDPQRGLRHALFEDLPTHPLGAPAFLHTRSQQTWLVSGGKEHGRLLVGLAAARVSALQPNNKPKPGTSLPTWARPKSTHQLPAGRSMDEERWRAIGAQRRLSFRSSASLIMQTNATTLPPCSHVDEDNMHGYAQSSYFITHDSSRCRRSWPFRRRRC
jgi:hypothetical protein